MGEYIGDIKLGTCENLYYATIDQVKELGASEYLNPDHGFRYRFPFPDESDIKVGEYADFNRGILFTISAHMDIEIAHDEISVLPQHLPKANRFYHSGVLGKIACPNAKDQILHFEIVQQKQVDGQLRTIVRCPVCGQLCQLSYEEVLILSKMVLAAPIDEFTELQMQVVTEMLKGYMPGLN